MARKKFVDPERIHRYFESLERLRTLPESARIFQEVFEEGLALLREFGRGITFFGFGSRTFSCGNPENDRLGLHYRKSFYQDILSIMHASLESEEIFGLLREKGNLTSRRIAEEDLVTRLSTEESGLDRLKGLTSYEPKFLTIQVAGQDYRHKY